MPATSVCPKCRQPTPDGICRHCLFDVALDGMASDNGAVAPRSKTATPDGYDLLHQIGAGATASVWLAREQKLNRLVALKFIPATSDERLRQRLVREGQAVARLRHRHIVAVHAMEVDDRHAYLAMDFLEGGDLRERLATGLPSPQASAVLVGKLADALAHAHADGLLHRDIKPSNVLLDDDGEPHLADFGLAAPLAGGGDVTLPGQIAGTAAYLAPELLGGADRASPQSDLYGLGAVLYECLTGRAPFIGETSASIFAQLAEAEPPAPRFLRANIPRDLETICLKCLEKAPARRYESASALKADLDRFLRNEPIAARPITRTERVLRWAGRNPTTASSLAVAAMLVATLAVGGPLVALRLSQEKARATAEAASSKALSDFLEGDLLAQAAPENEPDRDLRLRTVLDRAAKRIDGRFPQQPLVEANVRDTIANTYFALGEFESARGQWQRVYEVRQHELGPQDAKTLRAGANLFTALRALSRYPEAEKIGLEVVAQQRRVLAPTNFDLIESLNNLAMLYRAMARYSEAEALYVEAIEKRRAAIGIERPETLALMGNLAVVYMYEGKLTEAEALTSDVLTRRQTILGHEHPDTLQTLQVHTVLQLELGNFAGAERSARELVEVRRRVLGPEHPETLASTVTLANALRVNGKFNEAEDLGVRMAESFRRVFGVNHASTIESSFRLARIYHDAGKLAEAEPLLSDALAREKAIFGPAHPTTLATEIELGRLYFDQGRLDQAQALATEVGDIFDREAKARNVRSLGALELLGRVELQKDNPVDAEKHLRRAIDQRLTLSSVGWELWTAKSSLGEALTRLKRFDEAEPLLTASYAGLLATAEKIPAANRNEIARAAGRLEKFRSEAARPASSAVR